MGRTRFAALSLAVGLVLGALAVPAFSAQEPGLDLERLRQGWRVFNEKQCTACHAVWGEGQALGPDLGRIATEFLSAAQLAGVMWNHAPDMWSRMISRGIPVGEISEEEMQSLFLFLYFVRFMDEPGNPVAGEALAHRKKCVSCHATEPGEPSRGPDFRTLGAEVNPVVWAGKLWNHAPEMYREMRRQGVAWPTFEDNEMVDLIAYVRSVSPGGERSYLEPGDEGRGRKAFEEAGCAACHEGSRSPGTPQLRDLARNPRTVGQMAGALWNHAPAMAEAARSAGLRWSGMEPQQMVDLIAYFFSMRFYQETGDPARGAAVFEEKRCGLCHGEGAEAQDLRALAGETSAIRVARFMWRHGVEMLQRMEEQQIAWPMFSGDEFVDLLAFLKEGRT
ncbi:MAG: c-type cytochrome [Thermodesulfobacteriota bacterium]